MTKIYLSIIKVLKKIINRYLFNKKTNLENIY